MVCRRGAACLLPVVLVDDHANSGTWRAAALSRPDAAKSTGGVVRRIAGEGARATYRIMRHCEERSDEIRPSLGGRLPSAALMRRSPPAEWCGGSRARAPAPHTGSSVIARSEATWQSRRQRRDRRVVSSCQGRTRLLAMTPKAFRFASLRSRWHKRCFVRTRSDIGPVPGSVCGQFLVNFPVGANEEAALGCAHERTTPA